MKPPTASSARRHRASHNTCGKNEPCEAHGRLSVGPWRIIMERRQFITASAALAATAGLATAAQQDDVSRLGRTAHTKFAVNVEMWWSRGARALPFLRR